MQTNEPILTARAVAKELGQPTTGSGVDRLAAALAADPEKIGDLDWDQVNYLIRSDQPNRARHRINSLLSLAFARGEYAQLQKEVIRPVLSPITARCKLPAGYGDDGSPSHLPQTVIDTMRKHGVTADVARDLLADHDMDAHGCDVPDTYHERLDAGRFDEFTGPCGGAA